MISETTPVQTAVGWRCMKQNQTALLMLDKDQNKETIRAIILIPNQKRSIVRFCQDGRVKERRIDNQYIIPVQARKLAQRRQTVSRVLSNV